VQLGSFATALNLLQVRLPTRPSLALVKFTDVPGHVGCCCAGMLPGGAAAAAPGSAYEFDALQYDASVPLSRYKGQVLVVVNIASE
jgi:hypothetical protein